MAETPRTKLLETSVEVSDATSWKWHVYLGDNILNSGFEQSLPAARFAANAALFRILVSAPGWDE